MRMVLTSTTLSSQNRGKFISLDQFLLVEPGVSIVNYRKPFEYKLGKKHYRYALLSM